MSLKARVFLILSGLFIFSAWGFRLYVLTIRWGTDPFRVWTISFAFIYLLIGLFLIWVGIRGVMAKKKHYVQLMTVSIFLVGYWVYRLSNLVLYPDIDPNPRAHLHLSITFIVIGALLFLIGWRGQDADWKSEL